jgi:hypothetical protein
LNPELVERFNKLCSKYHLYGAVHRYLINVALLQNLKKCFSEKRLMGKGRPCLEKLVSKGKAATELN